MEVVTPLDKRKSSLNCFITSAKEVMYFWVNVFSEQDNPKSGQRILDEIFGVVGVCVKINS